MSPLQVSIEAGLAALSSYLTSEGQYTICINNFDYEVSFNSDGAVELVKFIENSQDEADAFSFDYFFHKEASEIIKSTLNDRGLIKRGYIDRVREERESNPELDFMGLCIGGGGAKGLALPGIIMALGEKKLMAIEEVVGVSVGAVIASALAFGVTPSELVELGDVQDLSSVGINHTFLKTMFDKIVTKQLGPYVEQISTFLANKGYPLDNR
ncbi:patatin-like phospholipase family protein [Shewanella sp. 202IG2-18]|uniref:patatin-like phospholipase family protein n=1 Tax=Parashewanella hymeniacidonis TaxID=2807618 RepID=UPI0019614551|nr:patatin-like phospholipase family protein [Parashewanella hymeniacidonis]MBM7070935.1 patatin-like phospholipase family protein [Parashewanella hymeniacidonis]